MAAAAAARSCRFCDEWVPTRDGMIPVHAHIRRIARWMWEVRIIDSSPMVYRALALPRLTSGSADRAARRALRRAQRRRDWHTDQRTVTL